MGTPISNARTLLETVKETFTFYQPDLEVDGTEVTEEEWTDAAQRLSEVRDKYNRGEIDPELIFDEEYISQALRNADTELRPTLKEVGDGIENWKRESITAAGEIRPIVGNKQTKDRLENVLKSAYYLARKATDEAMVEGIVEYESHKSTYSGFRTRTASSLSIIDEFSRDYNLSDNPVTELI